MVTLIIMGNHSTYGIPALIADNGMRGRDELQEPAALQSLGPLYNKHGKKTARHYRPQDFTCDEDTGTCYCPAEAICAERSNCIHNGYIAVKFQGAQRD